MKRNKQALTKEEVLHIAKLANLHLTEKEIIKFKKQLGEILDFVTILNKIDTSKVIPTSQVTGLSNITREDVQKPSLSQNEALSQTKSKYKGYFKVKAVFE